MVNTDTILVSIPKKKWDLAQKVLKFPLEIDEPQILGYNVAYPQEI